MRAIKLFSALGLCLLSFTFQLEAQEGITGNWIMYFGQNRVSDDFSIHSEIQYRNHELAPWSIEQLLIRAGVNYHFAPNAFATAGYGYIGSHIYESEQSNAESVEHRIWEQFISTKNIGRVKLEHRYRIEQRWVNDVYKNRFRYRIMAFIPLNKNKVEPGAIFLGLYEEVFMNAEKVFFDRNRLYAALGYQLSASSGIQVGILNQATNDFAKYYVQFALVFNPDLRSRD